MTSQQRKKNLKPVKDRLKAKGWTHRSAATELKVSFEHLNRVLNGHRESARLLESIENLAAREVAEP